MILLKLSIPNRHKGKKLFIEQWKPIKDYENYMVSNLGRVKRIYKNGKERILKPQKDSCGYLIVSLYKNCKVKSFRIHRLVGFAFVKGWFEGAEVDHIIPIRNSGTNIWTNLRWVTREENMNNEITKRKISESRKRKVYCIELDKVFNSITEVSKELNISQSSISYVCKGRRKSAGGYHFIYYEDYLNIA